MNGDRGPLIHCTVSGHGTRCIVAAEKRAEWDKRALVRWRRACANRALNKINASVATARLDSLRRMR